MSWAANAQECEVKPLDAGGRANDVAQANFTCVVAKLGAALSRIEALESELEPFRAAEGAVLAFDRDRKAGSICPKGWSYFEPAGGRLVIGAGEHQNGLSEYPSFTEDPKQAVGGEERHQLTEAEMPRHTHLFKGDQVPSGGWGGAVTTATGVGDHVTWKQYTPSGTIEHAGGGEAHNNMPPFVALYFCRRD